MSAWAKPNTAKAACLSDIMNEQAYLSTDLSLAESLFSFEANCYDSLPLEQLDYADADFAMALSLQEQLFADELE
jgi:hypothetical protein